jgi:hypothetical protein
MKILQQFEIACQQVKAKDGIKAMQYRLQGKDHDPAVLVNPKFRTIAKKYLYYEQKSGPLNAYYFSWQQVTEACKLADIYVSDVVKKYI